MATTAFRLRELQRASIARVLTAPKDSKGEEWKVLVMDKVGAQIVSAAMSGAELRRYGVTMQVGLESGRGALQGVGAVYIVSPTAENVGRILKDVDGRNRVYEWARVAFTTAVKEDLLRGMGNTCGLPCRVRSVHDLYAGFVTNEDSVFSANLELSFAHLHSGDESRAKLVLGKCVDALLCVLVTLHTVPVIRAARGGASEYLARMLCEGIRERLPMFQKRGGRLAFRRPLLLLLDRETDVTPMLHHSWMYEALLHDCLQVNGATVSMPAESGDEGGRGKRRNIVLDKCTDEFWASQAWRPFPSVAEAIEKAVTRYQEEVGAINEKTGDNAKLADAISALPELSRRKEAIDTHTNLCGAVMKEINSRKLDAYFELEVAMLQQMSPSRSDANAYLEQLTQLVHAESGSEADRVRCACVYYAVFGALLDDSEALRLRELVADGEGALKRIGRKYEHGAVATGLELEGSKRARLRGMVSSAMSRGYRGLAALAKSTLVGERGVTFGVARILGQFLSEEVRNGAEVDVTEEYLYFDPKIDDAEWGGDADGVAVAARRRALNVVYEDAIVFVSGGGNAVEAANCVEMGQEVAPEARIVYGSTEMMTAGAFLKQIV